MRDIDFHPAPALVTGGAGFIGSHLAQALLERGCAVTILDDLSTGFESNIPDGATFIQGSILDADAVDEAVAAATGGYIFHQAAMVSVPLSVEQPAACLAINLTGTQLILDAARQRDIRRVVFASSAAVYGDDPQLPSTEDDPTDPRSPYAAAKLASEHLLQSYTASYGLSTVSLRYFNIFGERQSADSAYAAAIAAFAAALQSGTAPTVFGDGLQTRDFTHVANVVEANLRATASPAPLRGEPFNIGTGEAITLLDVINTIAATLDVDAAPTFGPPRAGDVRHSRADIHRARATLAYEPGIDLEAGLRRMLADSD